MGYFLEGETLAWKDTVGVIEEYKKRGVEQLLRMLKEGGEEKQKGQACWGDEVEFTVVRREGGAEAPQWRVWLEGNSVIEKMAASESSGRWHYEYGSYMVESVPWSPYPLSIDSLANLEENMRRRREALTKALPAECRPVSLTVFPLLGMPGSMTPEEEPSSETASGSWYWPAAATQAHPRFSTLTRNIIARRERRVGFFVPREGSAFGRVLDYAQDCHFFGIEPRSSFVAADDISCSECPSFCSCTASTAEESADATPQWEKRAVRDECAATEPTRRDVERICREFDLVYLDAMGFGMGLCCLQMTYGFESEAAARHGYDQMAILAPFVLALSAATPYHFGELCNFDARWPVIEASVDCRRINEHYRDVKVAKSRYSSVACYVSPLPEEMAEEIEEIATPEETALGLHEETYTTLRRDGVDPLLARHFAYLFVRDPLVVYQGELAPEANDVTHNNCFENIQSTNWNTVRLKPPDSHVGATEWRVEFRSPDSQLTDFENAALAGLTLLVVSSVADIEQRIAIRYLDENVRRASLRDAVLTERFFARSGASADMSGSRGVHRVYEVSAGEFLFGHTGLVTRLIANRDCASDGAEKRLAAYLHFLYLRAFGFLPTNASFLRGVWRSIAVPATDLDPERVVSPQQRRACDAICDFAANPKQNAAWAQQLWGPYAAWASGASPDVLEPVLWVPGPPQTSVSFAE